MPVLVSKVERKADCYIVTAYLRTACCNRYFQCILEDGEKDLINLDTMNPVIEPNKTLFMKAIEAYALSSTRATK